jgi:hypothetical protein
MACVTTVHSLAGRLGAPRKSRVTQALYKTPFERFRGLFAHPLRTMATLSSYSYLVVGGGNASGTVAREFVASGSLKAGQLCIITDEPVSKWHPQDAVWIALAGTNSCCMDYCRPIYHLLSECTWASAAGYASGYVGSLQVVAYERPALSKGYLTGVVTCGRQSTC